jgi:hypothetical protein
MNLQRAILQVLSDTKGHLMTTEAIHSQVRLATGQDKTLTETKAELEALERKGHAKGVTHEDYGHRWVITDGGTLRLAE